jgi:signal recognition particle GTPase
VKRCFVGNAEIDDAVEVFDRDRAYGRLSSAGDFSRLVENAAFDHAIGAGP